MVREKQLEHEKNIERYALLYKKYKNQMSDMAHK